MILAILVLVIVFSAAYLVTGRFVSLSRETEYEITLFDEDEEDGAW